MDAKEFLESNLHEARRIEVLEAEKRKLQDKIDHITQDPTAEHVGGGGNSDKIGDLAAAIADMTREIERAEEKASWRMMSVQSAINSLEDTEHQQILCYRYVYGKRSCEVAMMLHISERTEQRHCRSAISEVQKLLDDAYYCR